MYAIFIFYKANVHFFYIWICWWLRAGWMVESVGGELCYWACYLYCLGGRVAASEWLHPAEKSNTFCLRVVCMSVGVNFTCARSVHVRKKNFEITILICRNKYLFIDTLQHTYIIYNMHVNIGLATYPDMGKLTTNGEGWEPLFIKSPNWKSVPRPLCTCAWVVGVYEVNTCMVWESSRRRATKKERSNTKTRASCLRAHVQGVFCGRVWVCIWAGMSMCIHSLLNHRYLTHAHHT